MSKKLFALVLGAFALAGSAFGQYQLGAPWPRFQADNSASGRGGAGGSNGKVKWETTIGGDGFFGSPAIDASGNLYAASGTSFVYAFNSSGTLLWTCTSPTNANTDEFVNGPVIGSDGTLYVANSNGYILAIRPSDGFILWSFLISDRMVGSPAIGPDGTLYVEGTSGVVYALNPGTPATPFLWKYGTGGAMEGTPSIGSDGSVYVANGNGLVVAISGGASGGSTIWSYAVSDAFLASPVIGPDGTLYLEGGTTAYAIARNGNTVGGTLVWSQDIDRVLQWVPTLSADGSALFCAEHNGTLFELSTANGSILQSITEPPETFSSAPAIGPDGAVYLGGVTGNIYAFMFGVSGVTTLWKTSLSADFSNGGLAIGSDGTVYAISTHGGIYDIGTPYSLTSLTLSDPVVIGGSFTVTGTVNLASAAPTGGWLVNLSSNSSYVSVPASVTVPAGSTSVTFTITPSQPPQGFTCTITGTDADSTQSANLEVLPDYIMSVSLSPSSIGGGDVSEGTVTVYQPAPPAGYVVNLSAEYPGAVGVPASITIPGGETQASFTITTGQFPNLFFECDIYASDGFSGAQAPLYVYGDTIASLSLSPSSIGCDQTSTGTVTLTNPAPSAGWVVNISDEYPGAVNVPATVTVQPGQLTATFTITPTAQFSNQSFECDIYASDAFSATQEPLFVSGDSIASVSFPTSVVGGATATGTVTLNFAAPAGGWTVLLSTEYPSTDGVPPMIIVPAGSYTATFTVTTKATGVTYGCDVYASDGVSGKQGTLTITHS